MRSITAISSGDCRTSHRNLGRSDTALGAFYRRLAYRVGILSMGVVTLYSGRLHFRSIWWRQSWWASWLSFLVGIALLAFFCGSPANHLTFGLTK